MAANVEKTFVLTGEAGGRKVFGRRGAADRHSNVGAVFLLKLTIRLFDRPAQIVTVRGGIDDRAGSGGTFGQIANPALVQSGEKIAEVVPNSGLRQSVAIGFCRQGEAVRYSD